MPSRGVIVVAGSLAQRPGQGGHAWVFLQYLLGFQRLGWEVLFLDRLEPEMCVDRQGRRCTLERSWNLDYLQRLLTSFDLHDCYALLYDRGERCLGLTRKKLLERVRGAALFMNVMGFVDHPEVLGTASRTMFLDIDPGFGQMWRALGWADIFAGHDHYVTIGENIGRPECGIPTCGLNWITTPQPIVLELWRAEPPPRGGGFVSIGAWRGPFDPIEYEGRTFGLRVHEFRRFMDLPRRSRHRFTLALDIDPTEERDLAGLRDGGWCLIEPGCIAGDPWAYRAFIHGSAAEFMVAKNMYVETRSGWFSDRSICFLASGRPVLAQDTGITELYPSGEGLVTFSSPDEAMAGAEAIASAPERHSRAAVAIAREHFDSDRVLPRLLENVGIA